jgi:hypothetical protein
MQAIEKGLVQHFKFLMISMMREIWHESRLTEHGFESLNGKVK